MMIEINTKGERVCRINPDKADHLKKLYRSHLKGNIKEKLWGKERGIKHVRILIMEMKGLLLPQEHLVFIDIRTDEWVDETK